MPHTTKYDARIGVTAAIVAFMTWGMFPLFFKQLASVGSGEILAHRVLWSAAILLLGFFVYPAARMNMHALRDRKNILIGFFSATLISINWFSFIHAVNTDRILEASLGYFLIPVVNALLGALILGEKLNLFKKTAVAVALSGVASIFLISGIVPIIALSISLSFGTYGLVRKMSPLDSYSGLLLETLLLSPFAALFLSLFGAPIAEHSPRVLSFLVLAGVMTLIPLLSMVIAARRLEYATLGFLQYLTPATQFIIAVFIYSEPISVAQKIAFGTVAIAVFLFLYGTRETRKCLV